MIIIMMMIIIIVHVPHVRPPEEDGAQYIGCAIGTAVIITVTYLTNTPIITQYSNNCNLS